MQHNYIQTYKYVFCTIKNNTTIIYSTTLSAKKQDEKVSLRENCYQTDPLRVAAFQFLQYK